jgi:hypothetical protein
VLERRDIALSVSLELWDPIFRPRAWRFAAERAIMPVPKAPMHQDDLPLPWKDKIGRSWQITPVQTKPVSHAMNHTPHYKLRLRVALSDQRHMPAHCGRTSTAHSWLVRHQGTNLLESRHCVTGRLQQRRRFWRAAS